MSQSLWFHLYGTRVCGWDSMTKKFLHVGDQTMLSEKL